MGVRDNGNQNMHKVDGVVFSKPVKSGTSKKGKPYEIPSLMLETQARLEGATFKTVIEFRLAKGVNINDFEVQDEVTVTFITLGKDITETWHKTENVATHIAFKGIQRRNVDTTFEPPVQQTEPGGDAGQSDDTLPF